MELYKIMLVDDEDDVREGIKRKINWNSIGFEMVITAENGQEALDLAEKTSPDVIITDIKMPFMDGLTLCKRLQEKMITCKVIILSGFDDFEYAQKAILYNVTEYLVKPIDTIELTQALTKLKQKMDEEIKEKRDVEKLIRHYMESLPIIREKFLVGLIEGRIPKDRLNELCIASNVDLTSENLVVCVIQGENIKKEPYERKLIPFSIKPIIEEYIERYCDFIGFIYIDYVVIIAKLGSHPRLTEFVHVMEQACEHTKKTLDITAWAGISSLCQTPMSLSTSFEHAKTALDYRVLPGVNNAIFIEDVEPENKEHFTLEEKDVQKMIRAMKFLEEKDVEDNVNAMIAMLKQSKLTMQQYQIFVIELSSDLLKFGKGYELDFEKIFGTQFNFYNDIFSFDSLDSLGGWLYKVCCNLRSVIQHERKDAVKLMAETSKQYIAEHFREEQLTVDTMCEQLHVSAAYFSTIFKRETGMSFITYLTQVRMQEAERLLSSTDDKSYIIAGKVGYAEANYFSYVFKKQYGMSPTKYRTGKIQQNEA